MRQAVYDHIQKKYHVKPEYLWRRYPDYAVFRHADNGKWFALAAGVRGEIAGVPDAEGVDVPCEVDVLITDRRPDDQIMEMARQSGTTVIFD